MTEEFEEMMDALTELKQSIEDAQKNIIKENPDLSDAEARLRVLEPLFKTLWDEVFKIPKK